MDGAGYEQNASSFLIARISLLHFDTDEASVVSEYVNDL